MELAIATLEEGAKGGSARAAFRLSQIYLTDGGYKFRNRQEGLKWYRVAGALGHPEARAWYYLPLTGAACQIFCWTAILGFLMHYVEDSPSYTFIVLGMLHVVIVSLGMMAFRPLLHSLIGVAAAVPFSFLAIQEEVYQGALGFALVMAGAALAWEQKCRLDGGKLEAKEMPEEWVG
jgi:hypothetical protein